MDFEVSQRIGLWFYCSNSLMLFCSPFHIHFNTIKHLFLALVFNKYLQIFHRFLLETLRPLNHSGKSFTVILPGYICCIKRVGLILHALGSLTGQYDWRRIQCCTGTDHATFRRGCFSNLSGWNQINCFLSYLQMNDLFSPRSILS